MKRAKTNSLTNNDTPRSKGIKRRLVEDELTEEQNLLRTLIDNLPDRIYAKDTQGRKTLSNLTDWKASGGRTMKSVIGKTDFETYPSEMAEKFWADDKAVIDSGKPIFNREEPGRDTKGRKVWVLSTKVPLRDNQGQICGLVGIGREITQLKLAEEKLHIRNTQLEKLAQANTRIMRQLGKSSLNRILTLIAKEAAIILDAEVCGIHIVKREGFLSLEASFGHQKGGFQKGQEFAIKNGRKTGLTGFIASEGKIFNSYGDKLTKHFAVRGEKPDHLSSGQCYSLLAIPLSKDNDNRKLVGLLRAENKKRDGHISPDFHFSREDEWILKVFANSIVMAIESAQLVEQINEKKDHQVRLFSSSPDCIIAIDKNGVVTDYNERAQNILGYTKEEVIGVKQVGQFYQNPKESRKIGRQLHLAINGQLADYETTIKSKNGEIIPIRLSATWLHNAQKQRIGSVGYFEDLRSSRETERVHQAAQIIARVSTNRGLAETLEAIATGARRALNCDIATLYTFDEKSQSFIHEKGIGCKDPSHLTVAKNISKKSDLWKMVGLEKPYFHVAEDVFNDKLLSGRFVQLEGVQSCIGIQLRSGTRRLGVLFIDYQKAHQFSKTEISNALYFGNQAAIAILNAQLLEETKRQTDLLQSLYGAITSPRPLDVTLRIIAKRALKLIGIDNSVDGFCHIALLEGSNLRDRVAWPPEYLSDIKMGSRDIDLDHSKPIGITGKAVKEAKPMNVERVKEHPDYIPYDKRTVSELAIPIKYKNKVIGVINVECHDARIFGKGDELAMEYLAAQAAIAIHTAKQSEEMQHNARLRGGLLQIGQAITSIKDRSQVLQTLVDGIKEVTDCDLVILYSYDKENNGLGIASIAGTLVKSDELNIIENGSVVRKLLKTGKARFANHSIQDDILNSGGFVNRQMIKSSAGIPLLIGRESVGIVFVNYRTPHIFNNQEQEDLKLFATQAGIAIQNARLYKAAEQRAHNLDAVIRVSQTVISSLDLDHILEATCQAAVELLGVDHSGLVLFDEELIEGKVRAEYPEIGARGATIQLRGVPAEEQLIKTKLPLMVPDVVNEQAFEPVRNILDNLGTRSMLIVPVISKGKILGSFGLDNMRSERIFTNEEVELCKVFAAQVAVAIENALQYEDLMKTKEVLAARTALAWTGMVSSTWRHAIEKYAITIREQIELLRYDLNTHIQIDSNNKRLNIIERLANQILDKPITPPLGAEEGLQLISVNELIRERTRQLWAHEPYKFVSLKLKFELDHPSTVLTSPEWLRRGIDILLDNAVDSTARVSKREIIINTKSVNNKVEISIIDNGIGITEEILSRLFREPIKESRKTKGLGMGLLFAQTIIQAYDGDIRCGATGASGTTMIISLPLVFKV